MAADPTKWKTGKTLGTRIPVDLYERLEHIGEQLIAAGLDEDDRRSKRGKRPTPLAVAVRRGLQLAADAMEAQLAAAPDSDTPPETAAAKTRARPARRLPVVKRKPDRRAEDGEPPAGKERRTKPRRRSDK